MNTYREIDDTEAAAMIAGTGTKGDYKTYALWPRMLDIVSEVGNKYNNTPYKYRCQELYAEKYKDGCDMSDGSMWSYLWYAATKKYHDLIQDAKDIDMINHGYTPITLVHVPEMPRAGTVLLAWNSTNQAKKCRVVMQNEAPFLIAPRARRSGWSAWNLATGDNRAYYKVIA